MVEMYQSINGKVINLFCVIGLNGNKITKYIEDDNSLIKYVKNIDIMKKKLSINCDKFENDNVKWLALSKKNNLWLRIGYSNKYENPITFVKLIECIQDHKNSDFILINKSYIENGYKPIKILNDDESDLEFPDKVYINYLGIY